jgi:hypothetical protein
VDGVKKHRLNGKQEAGAPAPSFKSGQWKSLSSILCGRRKRLPAFFRTPYSKALINKLVPDKHLTLTRNISGRG